MKASTHWVYQRISAIILMLLLPWFALVIKDQNFSQSLLYFSHPFYGCLLILLIASLFYHIYLGIDVIINDYVQSPSIKMFFLQLLKLKILVLFLFGFICIVRILAGGVK